MIAQINVITLTTNEVHTLSMVASKEYAKAQKEQEAFASLVNYNLCFVEGDKVYLTQLGMDVSNRYDIVVK